MILHSFRNL